MKSTEMILFRMAAVWTAIGLASGLGYRELTRTLEFTGTTQLSVVHTHALVLGTIVGLLLLVLERLYTLSSDRRFTWMLWLWNIGLVLTATGLAAKGSLQVLESPAADSPGLAGMSGMGHILLTLAFALMFLVLGRAIRRQAVASHDEAVAAFG